MPNNSSEQTEQHLGWLLGGLFLALCVDALTSTLYGSSKGQIMGTLHASAEEMSWYNLSYLMTKVACFPLSAWVLNHLGKRRLLLVSLVVLLVATAGSLISQPYPLHLLWRVVAGAAGAMLLVSSQTLLLRRFHYRHQGLVQAFYALGVVVVPVAAAPTLHGYLSEWLNWSVIYYLNLLVGLLALLMLWNTLDLNRDRPVKQSLDPVGLLLVAGGLSGAVYLLSEGPGDNWFEDRDIVVISAVTFMTLGAAVVRHLLQDQHRRLIDISIYRNPDFFFGFKVSLIAGFVFFGSGFMIPAFSSMGLSLNAYDTGLLLLPSTITMLIGVLMTATLIQFARVDPIKLVPLGLTMLIVAFWWLSRLTLDVGRQDLWPPLMIRGMGMGILFIGVTMVALTRLDEAHQPYGVALFNTGRQLGGLIGVSYLSTFLNGQLAQSRNVLIGNMVPNHEPFVQRQQEVAQFLLDQGVAPAQIPQLSAALMQSALKGQATVLSFNEAFFVLVLFFVFAIPSVLGLKLFQKKRGWQNPPLQF